MHPFLILFFTVYHINHIPGHRTDVGFIFSSLAPRTRSHTPQSNNTITPISADKQRIEIEISSPDRTLFSNDVQYFSSTECERL